MAKITVVPSTIGVSLTNLSTLSGVGGVGSVGGSVGSVVRGGIVVLGSVEVTMVVGVPVVGGTIVVSLEMMKFCLTFFSQSVGLIPTDLGRLSLIMVFV